MFEFFHVNAGMARCYHPFLDFIHFLIISGSTTYLYGYSSDVSVHSDERISSHKLTVSLECDVSVTLVWSPNNNQAEKIVRFKVKKMYF